MSLCQVSKAGNVQLNLLLLFVVCSGLTSLKKFNNFSVISRQCLVKTGSSMLSFILLPH